MSTMDNWGTEPRPFKGLLIGDPGSAKTSAYSRLANEGFELFIADFDDGLEIIPKVIKDRAALKRIHYRTLTDSYSTLSGMIQYGGVPEAATKFVNLLENWLEPDKASPNGFKSYGAIHTWGPERVLVIDSVTMLGQSLLGRTLVVNGRNGQAPWQSDWGEAIDAQEKIMALLYSTSIRCNVIVVAHLTSISRGLEEAKTEKGYPSFLGSKLPPKVGRYFNSVLLARSITAGDITNYEIITQSDGRIELKCPAIELAHALPIDTAFSTIFKALGIKFPGMIQMAPPGEGPLVGPGRTIPFPSTVPAAPANLEPRDKPAAS